MYNSINKCISRACRQDIYKDGYCKKHHYYYIEKEYHKKINKESNMCIVDGCNKQQYSLGFCKRHKSQFDACEEILEETRYDEQKIVIEGDIAFVYFKNRKGENYDFFIIDSEDVDKALEYKWRKSNTGYATTDTKDETRGHLRYHNFILNRDYKGEKYIVVDHINGDKLDNRKSNLRITDRRNNQRNTGIRASNSSGVTGARWKNSNNCYIAEITINRKTYIMGNSFKFDDVVKIRLQAEAKYFKEYSNNFNPSTQTLQLTYLSHDDNKQTFIEVSLDGTILQFNKL